jgi:hypothetical protein
MAIELEFIDFIVPIATIKAKYPGGLKQCLEEHANLIGGRNIDCDWIEHDWINGGVYLAGTEPGKLVGRYDFKAYKTYIL